MVEISRDVKSSYLKNTNIPIQLFSFYISNSTPKFHFLIIVLCNTNATIEINHTDNK